MENQKLKLSFVIPCYGSEKTIKGVIEEIKESLEKLKVYQYEIILINDCSNDNTYDVIKELAFEDEKIVGINLTKNYGQHAALMTGFRRVTGDVIICLDDDGQTPADEVGKLLQKIYDGYDVVYACYEQKQHSKFRNFGSQINDWMTTYLLGKPRKLKVTSYFAAKRYIVDEIVRYKNPYPYVIGLILRTTKNITNVKVNHRERVEGTSGYSIKKLVALWVNGFTAFSVKPLRIATLAGVICAFIGFIFLLYIIINRIFNPLVPLGWSSVMAMILFIGGMLMLMLGIIGEYIGRIYICINNSPQYVIKEVIKKKKEENIVE